MPREIFDPWEHMGNCHMEANRVRCYHPGDRFYISLEAFGCIRTWPGLEGASLPLGTSVILTAAPETRDDFSTVPVVFVFPDGRTASGEISRLVLDGLPPERRYGSPLDLMGTSRATELTTAGPKIAEITRKIDAPEKRIALVLEAREVLRSTRTETGMTLVVNSSKQY